LIGLKVPIKQARHPGTARRLSRTRQELRRAIVVMTVLGPCRALELPGRH